MKSWTGGLVLGVIATLLAGVAIWLIVAYSGAYNVAASDPHSDAVRWTLATTMHRSIASRADDLPLPDTLPDDAVTRGAGAYAEYCAHCHGAPGREAGEWTKGMRPEPPRLVEAAAEWSPAEIHWIIRNGIKMSGMPAFGPYHDDQEILALTAFVSELPGLSADAYASMTSGSEHSD